MILKNFFLLRWMNCWIFFTLQILKFWLHQTNILSQLPDLPFMFEQINFETCYWNDSIFCHEKWNFEFFATSRSLRVLSHSAFITSQRRSWRLKWLYDNFNNSSVLHSRSRPQNFHFSCTISTDMMYLFMTCDKVKLCYW